MSANPDSIWILVDGEEKGPFAEHELREQELSADTLCAKQGDEKWRPLWEVMGQAPALQTWHVLAVAVGMVLLGLLIVGINWTGSSDAKVAEKFVTEGIVGPYTVRSVECVRDNIYRVTVDALNGFGGPVRTRYEVRVKDGKVIFLPADMERLGKYE